MKKIYVCVVLLIAFGIFAFAGCSSPKEPEAGNPNGEAAEKAQEDTQEEDLPYLGYRFPEADYGGYVFRIYNATTFGDDRWSSINLTAEAETGEPINDAVYRRNALVEDRLDIKITETIEDRDVVGSKVNSSVLAGSDDWDAVFVGPVVCASLAIKGIFNNLNSVSTLNLDAPWWDQNARKSFSLGGALMFTATDAHINNCGYMWTIFYNKEIVRELGLLDLYQVVREGKWTLDQMHGYAKAAAKDLDGNGKFDSDDRFGITSFPQSILAYTLGMDFNPITLDGSGYPVINPPDERYISGIEKVRELLDKTTGIFIGAENIPGGISASFFASDKALFFLDVLSSFWGLRAMESDYGMIPFPKRDEAQERYYSWMGIAAPSAMIPKSSGDPERSGAVLEALSEISSSMLMNAYYEVTVLRKASRDEESTEMLELMRAGRMFDLASVSNWGHLFNGYRDNTYNLRGESLMAVYEKLGSATEKAIENTMDTFKESNELK